MKENELAPEIIGAAIEVHKILGPGLLESAYQASLARELSLRDIEFEREKILPLEYKGVRLDCGYRLDFLVGGLVIVELKSAEKNLADPSRPGFDLSQAARSEIRCDIEFQCRIPQIRC